jgi:hypothetical protein
LELGVSADLGKMFRVDGSPGEGGGYQGFAPGGAGQGVDPVGIEGSGEKIGHHGGKGGLFFFSESTTFPDIKPAEKEGGPH